VEARKARIRRMYLAARGEQIAQRRAIDPSVSGPPKAWIAEARAGLEEATVTATSPAIMPADAFVLARWLGSLIGPSAATWHVPLSDAEIANRLLTLAETVPPEAITLEDLRGAAPRSVRPIPPRGDARWIFFTRALARGGADPELLAALEDDVAAGRAPASLAIDLARALFLRGETGRAFVAL
jgi:hypothetical protein